MGDDAVGTHDGTVANGHAGQHADVVAQPHIVANDHRALAVHGALVERQAHVLALALSVAVVGDEHVGARQQAVADGDAVDGGNMGILTDFTPPANDDGGRIVADGPEC